ncbi:MAG: Panacea domain-containing protein, partial [Candidatus Giovannonibacteria bacterium]|nr:Panacea domain-containing protein [Candidatus Giovannonibacteria bacterium]
RGKKKLAKLLYFVDFDFFEKYQKYLTGEIYKALPMGPFPVALEDITAGMADKKTIALETTKEHGDYRPTEIYRCLVNPDESIFSAEEIKILDRVVIKYGHLNGKQLEELSHAEAPYVGTEPSKIIPYELSFYRGTDFNDL